MSKKITVDERDIDEIMARFENLLRSGKQLPKTFEIMPKESKSKEKTNEIAVVTFTSSAWAKMWMLVDNCEKEVAWHGTSVRTAPNEFLVKDIIVYPQKVSSATVTTDTEEYGEFMSNLDFECLSEIRFQAHSHVKMNVSPSSTDLSSREDIVSQHKVNPDDDFFYIFMIVNKDRKISGEVYDFQNNIIYDDDDIIWDAIDESGRSIADWMLASKKQVKTETVASKTVGYTSPYYTSSYKSNTKSVDKKDTKSELKPDTKSEKKSEKKDDKENKFGNTRTVYYEDEYFDDPDDYYAYRRFYEGGYLYNEFN